MIFQKHSQFLGGVFSICFFEENPKWLFLAVYDEVYYLRFFFCCQIIKGVMVASGSDIMNQLPRGRYVS